MPELSLSILVLAQDQASAALRQVEQQVVQSSGRMTQSSQALAQQTTVVGREITQTTRGLQLMAGSVLSQVNPALGAMVISVQQAAQVSRGLSLGLGGLVAAGALAATALALYVQHVTKTAREQAELNLAIRSLDTGALASKYKAALVELETFSLRGRSFVGSLINTIDDAFSRLLGLASKAEDAVKKFADLQAVQFKFDLPKAQLDAQIKILEAQRQSALTAEDERAILSEINALLRTRSELEEGKRRAATGTPREAQLEAAKERVGREIADIEQRIERLGRQHPALGGRAEIFALREKLESLRAERASAEALLGTAGVERTAERQIIEATGKAERAAAAIQTREAIFRTRLREVAEDPLIQQLQEEGKAWEGLVPLMAAVTAERLKGLSPRELEAAKTTELILLYKSEEKAFEDLEPAIRELAMARRGDAVALEEQHSQQLRLQQQLPGLTQAERDLLEVQALRSEELARLARATSEVERQGIRAEIALREQISRARAEERTDPFAGLAAGLREVSDEFLSFGDHMRSGVRSMGQGMARHFSDTFVSSVTMDFKRLQDLPKQFGLSILRSIGDVMGQIQTGLIFKGIQRAFPGLGLVTGNIPITAQQAAVFQAQGIPVGVSATGGFAIQGGGLPLSFLPQPGFLSSFLATPLIAGPAVSGEAASAFAAFSVAPATSPALLTLGQALGIAGGGAGLGLTVWSALQGAPTFQNIATSGVSGALSGALLGTAIGGPGIGTLLGAIGGGIIGAGAGAFGKGGRKTKGQREQKEAGRATGMAQNLINEIGGTQTPEALHAVLTKYNSGYVGGTTSVAIVTMVRGVPGVGPGTGSADAPFVGNPNPTYRVATVAELMANPDQVLARVQAGVDRSLLESSDRAVEQAIRSKIGQLQGQAEQEAGGVFAFEEVISEGREGGGLLITDGGEPGAAHGVSATRRTFLATSPSGIAQGTGQQLIVSRQLLEQLIGDKDMVERILRKLVEVDKDRDLKFLNREDFGLGFA